MKPVDNSATNVIFVQHTSTAAESGFTTTTAAPSTAHVQIVVTCQVQPVDRTTTSNTER